MAYNEKTHWDDFPAKPLLNICKYARGADKHRSDEVINQNGRSVSQKMAEMLDISVNPDARSGRLNFTVTRIKVFMRIAYWKFLSA